MQPFDRLSVSRLGAQLAKLRYTHPLWAPCGNNTQAPVLRPGGAGNDDRDMISPSRSRLCACMVEST